MARVRTLIVIPITFAISILESVSAPRGRQKSDVELTNMTDDSPLPSRGYLVCIADSKQWMLWQTIASEKYSIKKYRTKRG